MHSMTGYGSFAHDNGSVQVSVRIRSVNHRNLDMVVRMPEEYRPLEMEVRERLGERLHRGRVELRLDVEDRRERPVTVDVNKSWIAALVQAQEELEEARLDLDRLRLGDLLRIPDAVRITSTVVEDDSETSEAVFVALQGAVEDLASSRAQEGEKLQRVLEERLDALSSLVQEISAEQDDLRAHQQERLRSRIEELTGDEDVIDERRLEQEIAYLAERSDVREELDRLATHLTHFRETMAQPGAIGKKLDFITQEISRELSTLGAKFRQAGILQRNVEAKLICEQIREQIQNIE